MKKMLNFCSALLLAVSVSSAFASVRIVSVKQPVPGTVFLGKVAAVYYIPTGAQSPEPTRIEIILDATDKDDTQKGLTLDINGNDLAAGYPLLSAVGKTMAVYVASSANQDSSIALVTKEFWNGRDKS